MCVCVCVCVCIRTSGSGVVKYRYRSAIFSSIGIGQKYTDTNDTFI